MKTVGIIGGMGPLATADLFRKTVMYAKASCDQEHIHLILDNNTNIADRTAALLHGGADPFPEMKKSRFGYGNARIGMNGVFAVRRLETWS